MSDIGELLERAQKLQQELHGIQIRGPGWSGSTRQGFIFNPGPGVAGESGEGSGGGGPPPPPIPTGACCIAGDCSILTEADCIAAGGDYQGDSTPCVPNPCQVICDGAVGHDIMVEFSGIAVDCACQVVTGTPQIVSDLNVNTTYILTWASGWTDFNSQIIAHNEFHSNSDCSDAGSGSDFGNGLVVNCLLDGTWQVRYYDFNSANELFFFATGAPFAPMANQLTVCGPYPAAGGSSVALAHGGTCTITIL